MTRTPKNASSTQQRHHDVRRAEQVEQQAGDDVADRAAGLLERSRCRRARAAGCRRRCARCRARRTTARAQPTTWRPAGPLCSGSRRLRQPTKTQQQRDEPADLADRAGDDGAGRVHDRAGQLPPDGGGHDDRAARRGSRPTPSRRCSGSRSRAVWPIPRATAPRAWAIAEPDRGDAPPERAEERARSGPGRCGRRAGPAGEPPACACASTSPAFALACARPGTPGSGARAAFDCARCSRRGRALAPRPRRGRRTGRHAQHPRQSSHQSHGPHECVSPGEVRDRRITRRGDRRLLYNL